MTEEDKYRYKMFRSGGNSDKYGPCEVCGEHVSDVFHQFEEKRYWSKIDKKYSWTCYKCTSLFGHEQCLIGKRR